MPDIPVFCDDENDIVIAPMAVGSPLAVSCLKELIARGVDKFILCGGAGVLEEVPCGAVMVPVRAIRDEGTSCHYLPPETEGRPSEAAVTAIH